MVRASQGQPESYFRLGFLVHDVSRLRQRVADKALKPIGLTRAQFWLLSNLGRREGESMMQTELASALDFGKVALGALLDRLEAGCLIVRRADPSDRRVKRIELTQAGRSKLAEARLYADRLNTDVMQGITSAEITIAEDILSRMKQRLLTMDDGGWADAEP